MCKKNTCSKVECADSVLRMEIVAKILSFSAQAAVLKLVKCIPPLSLPAQAGNLIGSMYLIFSKMAILVSQRLPACAGNDNSGYYVTAAFAGNLINAISNCHVSLKEGA